MTVSAIRSRVTDLVRQWTPLPPRSAEETETDLGTDPTDAPPDSTGPGGSSVPQPSRPVGVAGGSPSWRLQVVPPSLSGARVRALGLGLAALLLVVGWWWWQGRPHPVTQPAQIVTSGTGTVGATSGTDSRGVADPAGVGEGVLIVDVTGPVRHPGIVEVPLGARVIDAIEAAGGLRRGETYGTVNLARPLVDGEQIVVGSEGSGGATGGSPARLSLNQATAVDLEELPGVGPVLAARIIEWRDRNGGFRSIDELREVSGIGDATFADLSPLLTAP